MAEKAGCILFRSCSLMLQELAVSGKVCAPGRGAGWRHKPRHVSEDQLGSGPETTSTRIIEVSQIYSSYPGKSLMSI